MADYRVYMIGSNGRFAGVEEGSFESDEDAKRYAATLATTFNEAEIWSGMRLVGRVAIIGGVEALRAPTRLKG